MMRKQVRNQPRSNEVMTMRTHVLLPTGDKDKFVGCAVGGEGNGAGAVGNGVGQHNGASNSGGGHVSGGTGGSANGGGSGIVMAPDARAVALLPGRGIDRTGRAGMCRRVGPN